MKAQKTIYRRINTYKNTFFLVDNWTLKLHMLGLKQTDILRQAYLPSDLFSTHNATVTDKEYFRLFDVMHRHMTDSPLGVEYAKKVPIEAFSPAVLTAFSSADFNTAMRQMIKYRKLICPLRIKVDVGLTETIVTIEKLEGGPPPQSVGMVQLAMLVNLLRKSTKETLCPLWVTVTDKVTKRSAYEEFFGAPLTDGPRVELAISAAHAALPFKTSNQKLIDLLEPSLDQHIIGMERDISITDRVQDIIRERLSEGSLTIKDVSQSLGRSVRSLQRDLTREHITFKQIMQNTRKEMAYYYLADTDLSIAEIAHLLGFVDSASFFRVFKRWTGKTPRRYRTGQAT